MYRSLLFLALCSFVSAADWKLVWSDEFDKAGTPDPKKWGHEVGFVRNQELQYYTEGRRENARVENGHLIIEARHEKFHNPAYQKEAKEWNKSLKEAEYTSACLITEKLKAFKYGKIEVRAKLPNGKGTWPAIWMLGENRSQKGWPACGEIDIMEFVSHTPNTVHGTMHFVNPESEEKKHKSFGGNTKCDTLHSEFHIYGIIWDEKTITVTLDEKPYITFDIDQAGKGEDNPFRKPQYLLLNLAIGGTWGKDADPKVYPQKFEIDWVRVWEKA